MKHTWYLSITLVSLLIFGSGCNSKNGGKQEDTDVEVEDTVFDAPESNTFGDSLLFVQNKKLLWQVDDSNRLKLKKPKELGIDTMSVMHIIQLINSNYDSIHLEYIKISHDTIYVHIPNSEMLTERIGSTGAEMFMASTTYSLTELKGIKYVNFDFIEGDHAAPGVYDRSYFRGLQ
jgi:hypothetical protein